MDFYSINKVIFVDPEKDTVNTESMVDCGFLLDFPEKALKYSPHRIVQMSSSIPVAYQTLAKDPLIMAIQLTQLRIMGVFRDEEAVYLIPRELTAVECKKLMANTERSG